MRGTCSKSGLRLVDREAGPARPGHDGGNYPQGARSSSRRSQVTYKIIKIKKNNKTNSIHTFLL